MKISNNCFKWTGRACSAAFSAGHGPQPPYEDPTWARAKQTSAFWPSVVRSYAECGIGPTEGANRPTIFGLSSNFCAMCASSKPKAWEKGDGARVQCWQSAENDFLRNHLVGGHPSTATEPLRRARTGFYRGFAHVVKGVIAEMQSHPGPDPGSNIQA